MSKVPLTTITNSFGSKQALNNNFDDIEDGFDNTLSRDGSSPNTMQADIDMNSNDLLNAGTVDADVFKIGGNQVTPTNLGITPTLQTWTPVLRNLSGDVVTVTEAIGNYVKLGPLVFISGVIKFTSDQINDADVLLDDVANIGGLPHILDTSEGIEYTPLSVFGVQISDVWSAAVYNSGGSAYILTQNGGGGSWTRFQDWADEVFGTVSIGGLYMTSE